MRAAVNLSLLIFSFICFLSCDKNDDNLKLTKENGKPSMIQKEDGSKVYFYYDGDKLSEIKEIKGSVASYKYENDDLVSVSYAPEDKAVADGHAFTKFQKMDTNKIRIESSGEPSFDVYKWEIDVFGGLPMRITELGFYSSDPDRAESPLQEGLYYGDFAYDPTMESLLKLTIYNKETNEKVATYTYEYDDKPGAISKIDLPLWYYAYRAYRNRAYFGDYNKLFDCHVNNILGVTIDEVAPEDDAATEVVWTYDYNDENYPVTQTNNRFDLSQIRITY